jgi:hypothetical protein
MFRGDHIQDFQARLEFERKEAADRRTRAISDQQSDANAPSVRVQIWEKLHHVTLPADPEHRILEFVAQQTNLSLEDVREVQKARKLPR